MGLMKSKQPKIKWKSVKCYNCRSHKFCRLRNINKGGNGCKKRGGFRIKGKKVEVQTTAFDDTKFRKKLKFGGTYTCPHCGHYFETREIKEIVKCPKCKSII